MADLLAAAKAQIKYAANELRSGDKAKALEHLDKAEAFIERANASTPAVPPDENDPGGEPEAATPWSEDRNEAIHQVLAETGHDTGSSDPASVIVDASPEQLEALTVLGYFGAPGTVSGIDYEPYERYYEKSAETGLDETGQPLGGAWTPKADYPTGDAVWQHYLANR